MPIFARFEKLQKYFLGKPFIPEEFKPGKLIIIGEYENQEQCETGILYRWFLLTDDYICLNFSKYEKYIYQISEDNGKTWTNVIPEQTKKGELIEKNSKDCSEMGECDFLITIPIYYGLTIYRILEDGSLEEVTYEDPVDSNGLIKADEYCFGFKFHHLNDTGQSWITDFDFSAYNTSRIKDMSYMFSGTTKLKNLNITNFITNQVINMRGMFKSNGSLTTLNLSSFNTSNVEDMAEMFSYSNSLITLNLSNFVTSNVKDISQMFSYCSKLTTLNLSSFDTSNVEDMSYLFNECSSLTELDLSSFDTSNVKSMVRMFASSGLTTLNLTNFITSKVNDFSGMFTGCMTLTDLNLSNFTLYTEFEDKDKNPLPEIVLTSMFANCLNLKTVDISGMITTRVGYVNRMFYGCNNLEYINMSNFELKLTNNSRYIDMFTDCNKLKTIKCSQTFKEWCDKNRYVIGLNDRYIEWEII